MDDQTKQLLTCPAFWKKTIADHKNPEGKAKMFFVCAYWPDAHLVPFLLAPIWYPLVSIGVHLYPLTAFHQILHHLTWGNLDIMTPLLSLIWTSCDWKGNKNHPNDNDYLSRYIFHCCFVVLLFCCFVVLLFCTACWRSET